MFMTLNDVLTLILVLCEIAMVTIAIVNNSKKK